MHRCRSNRMVLMACAVAVSFFGSIVQATGPPTGGGPADRVDPGRAPRRISTPHPSTKLHPTLLRRFDAAPNGSRVKAWVFFRDKSFGRASALRRAEAVLSTTYNRRAIERRRLRRTSAGLFDARDLPVAESYVQSVEATGVEVHVTSRWLNGVSAWGTQAQFEAVATLPFVTVIQPVRRGRRIHPDRVDESATGSVSTTAGFYGLAAPQLAQINLLALHAQGFTGAGVIVGILDTGFQRTHTAFNQPGHTVSVIAEWDFVDNDPVASAQPGDPPGQHSHGTYILGTLGAYKPGELVGGAYDASFILCKTEDITAEYQGEEDNYVAGLEFIEMNGGDLATSSLGYIDWYTQADLDGVTAVTTKAVNIATANGLVCVTAAGNSGHDANPFTSSLIAPADALQVITCGAVDSTGTIVGFSSDGPSFDGRVKPEVLARGLSTQTVSPSNDTGYLGVSGTSLSTPLVAGAVACLLQAHPGWSVDILREKLFSTASDTVLNGTPDAMFVRGYGIIDALAASVAADCNANGVDDAVDIANGTSFDVNGNGIPDECECPATDPPTSNPDAVAMNRFLAIAPTNPGVPTSLRVTAVGLPAPLDVLNGVKFWVGPPRLKTESSGNVLPAGAPGFPTFAAARLQCTPFVTDFSSFGTIYIYGPAIVPGGLYHVQSLDSACLTSSESAYSLPFPVTTSRWGDMVKDCSTSPCGPPDGSVDVVTDVVAQLDKFSNLPRAPIKVRCDLEPAMPDFKIDIADITGALDAFSGLAYPFSAALTPCGP